MAKITITFEDVEDGVSVKMESDPVFSNVPNPENLEGFTQAQQMAIGLTEMMAERYYELDHEGDCDHDGKNTIQPTQ